MNEEQYLKNVVPYYSYQQEYYNSADEVVTIDMEVKMVSSVMKVVENMLQNHEKYLFDVALGKLDIAIVLYQNTLG